MPLQQNTDRILTTHVGSLPRPADLLDLMKGRLAGEAYDQAAYDACVSAAVKDCVRRQVETGLGVVTDGEQSKPGFYTYVRERLDGFEARPHTRANFFAAEVAAFPEYYAQYFSQAMLGRTIAPLRSLACVGPVKYRGEVALQGDIE